MTADRSISVVLVDDQDFAVEGWRQLLERSGEFAVVGSAGSGEEALEVVGRLQPDFCLLDLKLPGPAGAPLVRELRGASVDTKIVLLTGYSRVEELAACLVAGAAGCLSKDTSPADLARALRVVDAGKLVLDFGEELVLAVAGLATPAATPRNVESALSRREAEVLRLVADGHSNREIAAQLAIAEQTVKNALSAARLKLGAPNRTAAAMIAREGGMI